MRKSTREFLIGLQIVALAAQATPALVTLFPDGWQPLYAFVISTCQLLGAWALHQRCRRCDRQVDALTRLIQLTREERTRGRNG